MSDTVLPFLNLCSMASTWYWPKYLNGLGHCLLASAPPSCYRPPIKPVSMTPTRISCSLTTCLLMSDSLKFTKAEEALQQLQADENNHSSYPELQATRKSSKIQKVSNFIENLHCVTSPIRQVPPEIIGEILLQTLSDDLAKVGHCKHGRYSESAIPDGTWHRVSHKPRICYAGVWGFELEIVSKEIRRNLNRSPTLLARTQCIESKPCWVPDIKFCRIRLAGHSIMTGISHASIPK